MLMHSASQYMLTFIHSIHDSDYNMRPYHWKNKLEANIYVLLGISEFSMSTLFWLFNCTTIIYLSLELAVCLYVFLHFVYSLKLDFLVWQPGYSQHTFAGHNYQVTSLDFHPKKTDLLCSCDGNGEIRYWNVTQLTCVRVIKVSTLLFDPLKYS